MPSLILYNCRPGAADPDASVLLFFDQYMAQLENTVHVLWCLDDGFILEHRGHDRVSEGTSSGEGLEVEEGNIVSERKQCENGLVGIDGGNEKSS